MNSIKDLSSKDNGGVKKGVIIKKAIKEKSKNVVVLNVQSSSTNIRNEIGSPLIQKSKSQNKQQITPLNVIDLESISQQNLSSLLPKDKKDTNDDSMDQSIKRVEFFSSIDKKRVTVSSLERESEVLFNLGHKRHF